MEEIIKPIIKYHNETIIKPNLYGVSNLGRVWSYSTNKWLTEMSSHGYRWVGLTDINGKRKTCFIHRLVLEHFQPNEDVTLQINHKDENKDNNKLNNLEWCTANYNANYGTRNLRSSKAKEKRVAQCDKNTHKIIKIFNSVNQAAEELGKGKLEATIRNISNVARGEKQTCQGFYWCYVNDDNTLINESKTKRPQGCKKVAMLDKDTEKVIEIFNSFKEAADFVGVAPCSISQAVSGRLQTCKGYKWKNLEENG